MVGVQNQCWGILSERRLGRDVEDAVRKIAARSGIEGGLVMPEQEI